jgi:F0F1-type ATP synthase assembly protein I
LINKVKNPVLVSIILCCFTIVCSHFNFISVNTGLSIFAGIGLALFNFLVFAIFLSFTKNESGNKFLILTLGGTTFRLILMLITILLVLKFLKVDKFGFIFMFFILYVFFLIYEIVLIKDRLGKH